MIFLNCNITKVENITKALCATAKSRRATCLPLNIKEKTMKQKEALNYISKKISEGVSKASLYEELISKVRYKKWLLSYLAEFPDYERQKKLKPLNYTLFYLLLIMFCVHIYITYLTVSLFSFKDAIGYIMFNWYFFLAPIILIFILKDIFKFREYSYRVLSFPIGMSIFVYMDSMNHFLIRAALVIPWIIALCLSIVNAVSFSKKLNILL